MLLSVQTDLFSPIHGGVFPEQQIPHWEPSIHRVEKITNLCIRPDERSLNVWQSDIADLDIVEQAAQVVIYLLEASLEFAHLFVSEILYAFSMCDLPACDR